MPYNTAKYLRKPPKTKYPVPYLINVLCQHMKRFPYQETEMTSIPYMLSICQKCHQIYFFLLNAEYLHVKSYYLRNLSVKKVDISNCEKNVMETCL